MKTLFNKTWELSSNYSIAHTGMEVMKNRLIKTAMQKKEFDQNIEFVINKKANNRSKVSNTEEETEKPFILRVQEVEKNIDVCFLRIGSNKNERAQ